MSPERLEHLLSLVGALLAKKRCRSRETISPSERLVITLRYLATGDSQQSHAFNFCVDKATVCHIIRDTCKALWIALNKRYLNAPEKRKTGRKLPGALRKHGTFQIVLVLLMGSM